MKVSMIWAMSRNRVIGRGNTLPWRLPTDMQFFQRTTMGHPVIMGRRTFESMKAPLPGRTNIVITSQPDYGRAGSGSGTGSGTGVVVAASLADAIDRARAQCEIDDRDQVFIAGGARVYAEGLTLADRLYITDVDVTLDGDTFFPEFDRAAWRVVERQEFEADTVNSYPFTISVLDRAAPDD